MLSPLRFKTIRSPFTISPAVSRLTFDPIMSDGPVVRDLVVLPARPDPEKFREII
jgi:hypothetical protein